jgi:hypothetical protein
MLTKTHRAALAAAAGLFALGLVGPATAVEITLKVVERAANDVVTDTGAKDDSVGDILTFHNDIYDAANAKVIGSNNGWCIRTAVGKAWECFWTLSLEDGQITVEGPFLDGKDSMLAITGGTGAYAGKSGEMKLHARDEKGTEYDFVYMIAP